MSFRLKGHLWSLLDRFSISFFVVRWRSSPPRPFFFFPPTMAAKSTRQSKSKTSSDFLLPEEIADLSALLEDQEAENYYKLAGAKPKKSKSNLIRDTRAYLLAPPASGDTITDCCQSRICSLIHFNTAGSAYKLSTGMSKKPWNGQKDIDQNFAVKYKVNSFVFKISLVSLKSQ